MSTRLMDVAATLRSMAMVLEGTEQGEACKFALKVLEERNEMSEELTRLRGIVRQVREAHIYTEGPEEGMHYVAIPATSLLVELDRELVENLKGKSL